MSDGNLLQLAFSSNDKVVDVGFAATWRAIDPTEGKTEEPKGRNAFYNEIKVFCCPFIFPPGLFSFHGIQMQRPVEASSAENLVK